MTGIYIPANFIMKALTVSCL